MKTLAIILQLIRNQITDPIQYTYSSSLCHALGTIRKFEVITQKEFDLVTKYLEDNIPDHVNETALIVSFWWPERQIQPRLDWLDKHIKFNSDESKEH